jgi:DNA-binding beta-propeller fold protein YncE
MKLWKVSTYITLACLVPCLFFSGCGGSSGATTIQVTLTSSEEGTLILGQSTTITASVAGNTDEDVTWGGGPNKTPACTYTTTTYNSSGTPTTKTAVACPTDGTLGTLSNEQTTGTATFLAPSTLPSPTTYPGLLVIITACSVATPIKCNFIDLSIDSGIAVQLDPTTAAVPTGEKQPFFAILTNDLKNGGVTWLLTQQTPTGTTTSTNTNAYASLVTCTVAGNASGCGSIDANGVYTAPSVVPTATTPAYTTTAPTDCTTPQNVTVVATSVTDPTRFAIGTITITAGGPIAFSGIAPTIAPQGAAYWDIYLSATNMSSSSQITLTDSHGGVTPLNSVNGQVKILFPIPTSTTTTTTGTGVCAVTTTTAQTSSGARIRLLSNNLAAAGPVTVSVTDPGEPVTTSPTGTFTYNILPVRPTAVYSSPSDVIQNTVAQANSTVNLTIDGGYFGTNGSLANVLFPTTNTPLSGVVNGEGQPTSNAKQLSVQLPAEDINLGLPGLYSLSVARTTLPLPSPNNAAVTDLAVFPSYATNPPQVVNSLSTGTNTNPSAVDMDPTLGVLVVAETSANAVQFYSIAKGTLTPINSAGTACGASCPVAVGMLPTGLSVNRANHTVAVVDYGDQTVWVLPIPGAPVVPGTPFSINLSGVLQGAVTPAPLPYSIGVDPDTNMGIVAYSSTSASSISNLGFLVNLNTGTNPYGCLNSVGSAPCVYAQVTLDTGAYPQVAMAPHGHLAFVSPGGSGVLRGVDVTKPSTEAWISQLTLAAGIVTATTTASNGLVPGNSGAVLITGVPTTNTAGNANFNGVFTVTALSDTSFTFILNSTASGTVTIPLLTGSTTKTSAPVYYSTPNLTFAGVSQTTQGISINPITNTAALADADAVSSSQIYLLNDLDQSLSLISFSNMCTAYNTTCPGGDELLGTADVAWQPYSDVLVSYNPGINQVSFSDSVSDSRQAFACELGNATNMKMNTGSACVVQPNPSVGQPPCAAPNNTATACTQQFLNQITLQGTGRTILTVNNGTTGQLTLFGGLAVDPATNQAFVVMSGSNQIDIIDLGPCSAANNCVNPFNSLKPAEISDILVPSPNPGLGIIGGIPHATVPQGTLTSSNDLTGLQIYGAGFDASTFVRLDGAPIQPGPKTVGPLVQFVNSRQLTVTIPSTYLSFPHRFALDVVTPDAPGGSSQSNATDFFVIQAVDMTPACAPVTNGPMPSSVAVADQLANGPFSPIAVVSNSNCNNISIVDMNPADVAGGTGPNPGRFGTILNSVAVGMTPEGVAISQPLGIAVVANNGAGTVSTVNLLTGSQLVPDVATGTNPTGVAIDDSTGAALVTNTGSNTVTELNLQSLFGTGALTALVPVSIGGFQQPTAVAIDPDRGTNNQGLAIVTTLELQSGSFPIGGLAAVDIGLPIPTLSTTVSTSSVTAPTTGVVFDPTVVTGTANPGVFYASSSGGSQITAYNPDSGSLISVNVGINPTALAINPETGAILTTNVAGQTISIVDTTSSPLRTVKTIGLPGSVQFGVAIDQFTNLAVIVDQGNNRLLIFPMPN